MSSHHHLAATPETVQWGFFSAAVAPALTIESGDTVTVDTLSGEPEDMPPAGNGMTVLPEHQPVLAAIKRGSGPHLVNGPIAIAGAEPGDSLAIEILDIQLRQDWGWNLIKPLLGTLPADFPNERRLHVPIDLEAKVVRMPWGLNVPADPFFGVIATAPPAGWGRQTSTIPRAFGGNMDNKDLRPGTTLHLPVFAPGGLLSIGDGHAVQGHGEVCLTAIETALTGKIRVTLEKGTNLKQPWAETPSHFMTMSFDPDLDDAASDALREMIAFIRRRTNLSAEDAYTLCSIAADLHVTQLVDMNKGIHVMLPKWALAVG